MQDDRELRAKSEEAIAQAQLLHDLGVISTDALTSGRLLSEVR